VYTYQNVVKITQFNFSLPSISLWYWEHLYQNVLTRFLRSNVLNSRTMYLNIYLCVGISVFLFKVFFIWFILLQERHDDLQVIVSAIGKNAQMPKVTPLMMNEIEKVCPHTLLLNWTLTLRMPCPFADEKQFDSSCGFHWALADGTEKWPPDSQWQGASRCIQRGHHQLSFG